MRPASAPQNASPAPVVSTGVDGERLDVRRPRAVDMVRSGRPQRDHDVFDASGQSGAPTEQIDLVFVRDHHITQSEQIARQIDGRGRVQHGGRADRAGVFERSSDTGDRRLQLSEEHPTTRQVAVQ